MGGDGKDRLLALAARVEAATGADRELDCLIAVAAAGYFPLPPRWEGGPIGYGYVDANGDYVHPGQGGDQLVKSYTASIDAALTLVPEGWSVGIGHLPGSGWLIRAHLRDHRPASLTAAGHALIWVEGHSRSFPLALTAACLRARAQGAEA